VRLAFTSSALSDARSDEGKHNRRAMVLKQRCELSLYVVANLVRGRSAVAVAAANPGGAKSATNPTGAKTLKERGMGTGPSGTNPGGAGSATSPTAARTFEERGVGTGPSGTNPGGMGTPNQRGMGGEHATLNGANAPAYAACRWSSTSTGRRRSATERIKIRTKIRITDFAFSRTSIADCFLGDRREPALPSPRQC